MAFIPVIDDSVVKVGTFAKDIILTIVAVIGVLKIIKEVSNQNRLFVEGQNSKEREVISYKLNNFYGPFKALRTESRLLYDAFAKEQKLEVKQRKGKDHLFRTLSYLCEGGELSVADASILGEILKIEQKEIELIEKEGWAVNNLKLSELLGKFATHIRLLALASEGKISGMADDLKSVVYPRELDGALESEIRRLEDRYNLLLGQPKKRRKSGLLQLNEKHSVQFYDKNCLEYYQATAFVDMSELYQPFIELLPRGALILDAGCGVGRDTRYFIRNAYRVVAFDASAEMVKLCNEYPFAYCKQMNFDDIEYLEEFDGVWASGSLVHVPHNKLKETLLRLFKALKPNGVLHFSLKVKNGTASYQAGRTFYFYEEEILKDILQEVPFVQIATQENLSKVSSINDRWKSFIWRKPKA